MPTPGGGDTPGGMVICEYGLGKVRDIFLGLHVVEANGRNMGTKIIDLP